MKMRLMDLTTTINCLIIECQFIIKKLESWRKTKFNFLSDGPVSDERARISPTLWQNYNLLDQTKLINAIFYIVLWALYIIILNVVHNSHGMLFAWFFYLQSNQFVRISNFTLFLIWIRRKIVYHWFVYKNMIFVVLDNHLLPRNITKIPIIYDEPKITRKNYFNNQETIYFRILIKFNKVL